MLADSLRVARDEINDEIQRLLKAREGLDAALAIYQAPAVAPRKRQTRPVVPVARRKRRERTAEQKAQASRNMKAAWARRKKRTIPYAGDDAQGEPRPTLSDDARPLEDRAIRQ